MSGRVKIVADGETYDLTEDEAVEMAHDLNQAGVSYTRSLELGGRSTSAPKPVAASSEPHPAMRAVMDFFGAKRPQDLSSEQLAEADTSMPTWVQGLIGSKAVKGAEEPAIQALAQGAQHGYTMGLDQNIPGYGDWLRETRANTAEKAPFAYSAGDFAGSLASPGNFGKGVAGNLASAAVQGGARSFSDADPEQSLEDRAIGALKDAAADTAITGGVLAATSGAGKLIGGLVNKARESGLMHRVAATGRYGSDMRNLAKNKGRDYVLQLGQEIEDRGLHRGDGPLGFLPQPATTYGDNAEALRKSAGQRLDAAEDAVSALPHQPRVPMEPTAARLEQQAAAAEGLLDPSAPAEAAFRAKFAENLRGGPIGSEAGADATMEWADALANKRDIDARINWNRGAGYEGAPMQEAVRREVAGDLRSGVKNALDVGVDDGSVPAGLRDQWSGANDDYRIASDVLEPARKRELQEAGNQVISLPTWIAGGGGAAAGGIYGAATGNREDAAINALAGAAGASLLKSRGHAALAGTLGAVSRAGAPLAAGLSRAGWVATHAPTGAIVAQRLDAQGPRRPGASAQEQQAQLNNGSRGHALGARAESLIQRDPTPFGPWMDELANTEDSDQLAATIERLAKTDTRFAAQVMPLLNGATP